MYYDILQTLLEVFLNSCTMILMTIPNKLVVFYFLHLLFVYLGICFNIQIKSNFVFAYSFAKLSAKPITIGKYPGLSMEGIETYDLELSNKLN